MSDSPSTHRPSTAPDFLLSRRTGSVRTQGSRQGISDPEEAVALLRRRAVEMVVGALPFDLNSPAALTVPESIIREDATLEPHSYYRQGPGSVLQARVTGFDPSPEEHMQRVAAAVRTIKRTALDKVVLARAVDIEFENPVDPRLVAARLIDTSYNRDGFIADLTPGGVPGAMLVGCSPEVLVKKQGSTVSAYPLAGSAPRSQDPETDELTAQQLLRSSKNLEEHRYVVEHLKRLLTPLCSHLNIPNNPELTRTNEVWHLATPIVGTLSDPGLTALELALAVHPTPAICGSPTELAEGIIQKIEAPRRFYSGAVGWSDSHGDGEYMVAIRCAEVSGDGRRARAWAGGGIVVDSNPHSELEETTAKLRTILRALGL